MVGFLNKYKKQLLMLENPEKNYNKCSYSCNYLLSAKMIRVECNNNTICTNLKFFFFYWYNWSKLYIDKLREIEY